ncbi:PmoA family protein [Streptomyces capparidis]
MNPLRCGETAVAWYTEEPGLPERLSPRPCLHPVRTLAGTRVTETRPADHLHHLGVSLAVPDVAGRNFWGGRTYVRDRGPTELANHGRQTRVRLVDASADGFTEELSWTADPAATPDGRELPGGELLRERRTVAVRPLTGTAWALDLAFRLTNTSGADLSIGSPATNGRPGAGYGGFFWRAPLGAEPPEVFTADAEGEEAVHGRPAPWLALAAPAWTLVFTAGDEATGRDPWFVRTKEYPGVGSCLAWERRLPVPAAGAVTRRIVTAVADGRLDRAAVARLVTDHLDVRTDHV